MSSFSVWEKSFDPQTLIEKEIENFYKIVDSGSEAIKEYRRSGRLLEGFYNSLEESLIGSIVSYDDENSYKVNAYYNHLLEIIRNCKKTKIGLNNLSHIKFLLPWAIQPRVIISSERQSTSNLDSVLRDEILHAKSLSRAMSEHYSLRLVGRTYIGHRRGLLWLFLAEAERDSSLIEIAIYIGSLIRITGRVLLFDQCVNVLLEDYIDGGWLYIMGLYICWVRRVHFPGLVV